jgi:hypothetical protein
LTVSEPVNRARGANSGKAKKLPTKQAKERVIQAIRDGLQVEDAMALVDRTRHTYIEWRRSDASFKEAIDRLREQASAARRRGGEKAVVPDFPEFSATYLGHEVPEVHMRTYDMLQGRAPRNLHPAMVHNAGRPNMLLINYPPDHGKSTTWSVNYATYRVITDPNTRGCIISKTANLARQFLGAVKNRLTSPRYSELQKAFAPEGGFQGESWTQNAIFVGGRDSGEKDPTIQALGIGGQLYGARLDWVILDDVVDNSNAHRFDEQLQWITTEVISRLPDDGLIMVLGTRIAPLDLYSKLRDMNEYDDVTPLWSYLSQPAVLEGTADTPDNWKTLWPERWPGPALARRKATLGSAARWSLVYQQMDVSEEAVFPAGAVEASINKSRAAGTLGGGVADSGIRCNASYLYTVAGLDPATTGKTAMCVVRLCRVCGKRIVMDGFNMSNCPPAKMQEQIRHFTEKYGVQEWVIERNAFQRYLTQDDVLRTYLYGKGCILREHFTSSNKFDEDYGVMSMQSLFMSCVDPTEGEPWRRRTSSPCAQGAGNLIDLPNRQFSTFTDDLAEQLIVWQPKQNKRTILSDCVMALWFCEIACKRQLENAKAAPRFSNNPFLPQREKNRRVTIRLDELAAAAFEQKALANRL